MIITLAPGSFLASSSVASSRGPLNSGDVGLWSRKENIEACQVTRGMALSLAQAFAEWDLISTGDHQFGVVAQVAQGICPRHVFEIDYTPPATVVEGTTDLITYPSVKCLGVNNVGMAMEASMDNGAPDVLIILIDDLGYGGTSAFGGLVPTTNIDRLAEQGLRYTRFHNCALCSPSRVFRNIHAVSRHIPARQDKLWVK